jgi:excisionase family DNA binding protein
MQLPHRADPRIDESDELLARHRIGTELTDSGHQRSGAPYLLGSDAVFAVGAQTESSLPARPTLTVQETADLLGISRWLVQQAVRRGELPVVRIGRRILIPRVRLLALLAGTATTAV